VQRVTFGDEPNEVRTGRDRALAGQYNDSLEELRKINPASIDSDVIRQDLAYYTAFSLARLAMEAGGDKTEARVTMLNFVRQNPTTYHFFPAAELLGELSYALGEFDEAARYYSALAKAPWPEHKMKAAVLQARSQAAAGNHTEALANFEQVLGSGLNTPEATEQKRQATVGKAASLAATDRPREGIELLHDLIARNDPNDADLFGPAYNALGACYAQDGQTKQALLAYLHTDVLYFTNASAHAEALYHLSRLWARVDKSDRAVRARSLLQSRYAGTRWASMP
jgi:tetratricopeptide (TPR) repeat protein